MAELTPDWRCDRCGQPFHRICTKPLSDPDRAPAVDRHPLSPPMTKRERTARFYRYLEEAINRKHPPPTPGEIAAKAVTKRNRVFAQLALPKRVDDRLNEIVGEWDNR